MKRPKPVTNPKLYPVRMHLLLSTDQARKLAEMANKARLSMGQVLRNALDESSRSCLDTLPSSAVNAAK